MSAQRFSSKIFKKFDNFKEIDEVPDSHNMILRSPEAESIQRFSSFNNIGKKKSLLFRTRVTTGGSKSGGIKASGIEIGKVELSVIRKFSPNQFPFFMRLSKKDESIKPIEFNLFDVYSFKVDRSITNYTPKEENEIINESKMKNDPIRINLNFGYEQIISLKLFHEHDVFIIKQFLSFSEKSKLSETTGSQYPHQTAKNPVGQLSPVLSEKKLYADLLDEYVKIDIDQINEEDFIIGGISDLVAEEVSKTKEKQQNFPFFQLEVNEWTSQDIMIWLERIPVVLPHHHSTKKKNHRRSSKTRSIHTALKRMKKLELLEKYLENESVSGTPQMFILRNLVERMCNNKNRISSNKEIPQEIIDIFIIRKESEEEEEEEEEKEQEMVISPYRFLWHFFQIESCDSFFKKEFSNVLWKQIKFIEKKKQEEVTTEKLWEMERILCVSKRHLWEKKECYNHVLFSLFNEIGIEGYINTQKKIFQEEYINPKKKEELEGEIEEEEEEDYDDDDDDDINWLKSFNNYQSERIFRLHLLDYEIHTKYYEEIESSRTKEKISRKWKKYEIKSRSLNRKLNNIIPKIEKKKKFLKSVDEKISSCENEKRMKNFKTLKSSLLNILDSLNQQKTEITDNLERIRKKKNERNNNNEDVMINNNKQENSILSWDRKKKLDLEFINSRRKEMFMMIEESIIKRNEEYPPKNKIFDRSFYPFELSIRMGIIQKRKEKKEKNQSYHHHQWADNISFYVMIKNVVFHWLNDEFVLFEDIGEKISDRIFTIYKPIICIDPEIPEIFTEVTFKRKIWEICSFIIEFNTSFHFIKLSDIQTEPNELFKNCFDFSSSMLTCLGCPPLFPHVQNFVNNILLLSRSEKQEEEDNIGRRKELRVFKFPQEMNGLINIFNNSSEIMFLDHSSLDEFTKKLISHIMSLYNIKKDDKKKNKKEILSLEFPDVYMLLEGFDSAFWIEERRFMGTEKHKKTCPFRMI